MNRLVEGNLSMAVSKIFSGFNMNALKFLIPIWISPITGVTIRLVFGAVAFWIIDIFCKPENSSTKQKLYLMLLGVIGLYGYLLAFQIGLKYTTPISSSIFLSLSPIWILIISVLFLGEKVKMLKILGVALGFGSALVCIIMQPSDDLASNALFGNLLSLLCSFIYALFLILSNRFLKKVGNMTMIKFTFLGAAISALIVNSAVGFDAPVFNEPLLSAPVLSLLFVLFFPTTLSYLLLPIGIKYLSPAVVAIYGYLILVIAAITSFILGQDRFSWSQCGAIVLICLSVYLVEIADTKSFNKKKTLLSS